MRSEWKLTLLSLAAGVVAGCWVSDVYVARASAEHPKVRFEYRCISEGDYTSLDEVVSALNKAGQEGWELVAAANRTSTTSHYCLKRPY